jgi:hypothetical protein
LGLKESVCSRRRTGVYEAIVGSHYSKRQAFGQALPWNVNSIAAATAARWRNRDILCPVWQTFVVGILVERALRGRA